MKDRVKKIVQRKKLQAHSDEMLKAAKIEPPLADAPAAAQRRRPQRPAAPEPEPKTN